MPPNTRQPPQPPEPLADEHSAEAAQNAAEHERTGADLLSAQESARRLGISVSSFYDWLNQSDRGEFAIRGEPVTINYFQTGRKGQGRILLESDEVQRLKDLFRVRPRKAAVRRQPTRPRSFPGITVKLGRPN
ncbi:MAG TPA: DNA-binding protein [Pirellulales bacterium]|jgi:hypothetical protein|nr:DNA-binding protein [Pirellulales bacterium]